MHWAKQTANSLVIKHDLRKVVVVLLFVALYVVIHFSYLATNELNPDAVNWHKRSEQFVQAFKSKDLAKTNQHYHPGVTLMWIVGPPVELVKQLTDTGNIYNSSNYLVFHLAAKSTLLFVNLALSLFLIFFLGKLIGFWKSLFIVVLMNLEPFFLGNSRVLHMDVLFSNLVALSLVVSFYAFKTLKFRYFALSGFFAAITVLTRSVGIGIFVYNLAFFLYTALITRSRRILAMSGIFALFTFGICFVLFPALWVDPIKTVDTIFSQSYQIGVEDGHNQIFLGKFTQEPGFLFYPVTILLKFSPFLLFGVVLSIVFGIRILIKSDKKTLLRDTMLCKNLFSFVMFLFIFYAGYFLLLNISNKKIDRYILPLFFFLSYVSVWGYYYLLQAFDHILVKVLVGAYFVVSIIYPIYKFAPYEFLYYSPIFKNSETANNVISQKNFGMGVAHLKQFIDEKYGCAQKVSNLPMNFKPVIYGGDYKCLPDAKPVRIGLSDTKAMKELHGNSNTRDTRITGSSSYDVLVLAIKEDMPDSVTEDKIEYNKDASIFVNDVELWRIYVRKD